MSWHVSLNWSHRGLDARLARELIRWLDLQHLQLLGNGPAHAKIDVSHNILNIDVVVLLLSVLLRRGIRFTYLNLSHCGLDDNASASLASVLTHQLIGAPLLELHLSGNNFTVLGAIDIINAAHHTGYYPAGPCSFFTSLLPLKIWMDGNFILRPEALVNRIKQNGVHVELEAGSDVDDCAILLPIFPILRTSTKVVFVWTNCRRLPRES